MTLNVLFAALYERFEQYQTPLKEGFEKHGLDVNLATELAPETVDYIIYAPNSSVQDFTPYTKCKAVLNLWAGVESVVFNETLTQPLTRMVDDGLTQGMVEWVTGHTCGIIWEWTPIFMAKMGFGAAMCRHWQKIAL